MSAYEFRCPFGLVFDSDRLVCEWPWLVPKCANGLGFDLDSQYYYGPQGDQSAGVLGYDGLGALGVVKLGGVSGTLEKPIAQVFSNVGTGSLKLGYQNSGGYIEGGGLSYKAAQALQSAGLLKVNNGAGYQGYVVQGGAALSSHGGASGYRSEEVYGDKAKQLGVAGGINIIGGGYSAVGNKHNGYSCFFFS